MWNPFTTRNKTVRNKPNVENKKESNENAYKRYLKNQTSIKKNKRMFFFAGIGNLIINPPVGIALIGVGLIIVEILKLKVNNNMLK